MKKAFGVLVIILIIYGIYNYRTEIKDVVRIGSTGNFEAVNIPTQGDIQNIVNKLTGNEPIVNSICSQPVKYSLGNFDSKFGIDKEYFLKAMADAEKIWEDETGKNLFLYEKDTGELKINLIYDYRQETTDELKKIGITVNQSRTSYEEIKEKYNSLKSQYTKYKLNYDARLFAYNTRIKTFHSQIIYWNKNGGAPLEQFDILTKEKAYLEAEFIAIQNNQNILNSMVNQVNGLANMLNKQAEILNLNVKKYNTVGQTLGESYEEGLYYTDGTNRAIDIYEFQSYDQLVRILAHELGHAMGIGHLENTESIMHQINASKNLELSQEDKIAISTICGLNLEKQDE